MKSPRQSATRLTISAALSMGLVSGAWAQESPPQINAYQQERPVWNKTTGFEPVPKELQQVGDAECQKVKYDRAVGYSKQTLNPDGDSFQKGGFMCQMDPKSNS